KLAGERKLPVCTPSEKQVLSGTLFSYGFVHYEIGRQAAQLVDQILRGARPADLPVMTAENYLLINMKTAKTIGLEVPEAVVRQANRLMYE
ncbi:MAG: ABC transporter substrate binding protein, partial [Sedimenticola sp.]